MRDRYNGGLEDPEEGMSLEEQDKARIQTFIATNNDRVLAVLPQLDGYTIVAFVAVPVEISGPSPAYVFRSGDMKVVAPPNLSKAQVSMLEAAFETWAELYRKGLDAARVRLIN